MPTQLNRYKVFIGSPSSLDAERRSFRDNLSRFSRTVAEYKGAEFFPVGWEDTTCGIGRPQDLINEDLKSSDYAIFVFHDRWGTPTGAGFTSGSEEEWHVAQKLYQEKKLRNIVLFFKTVDNDKAANPDEQLTFGLLPVLKTLR